MAQQGMRTIDTGVMADAASTVDTQCTIIENCLSNIISDANSLKSEWEGDSADAYQAAVTKLSEFSPTVIEALKKYASDLNKIAQDFDKTNNNVKIESEALPSMLFSELGG
jgi:WXG100 family type VII secretion target